LLNNALVSFYDVMGAKKACKLGQPNCMQALEKAYTFQPRHQTLKPPSLRSPVDNFIALLADRFWLRPTTPPFLSRRSEEKQ
jgi:hypothetical protein